MDTAVKERLVGAVILVGLIVALVPEMLSGPRREAAADRAATDGTVRTYTIDLAPPVATPPVPLSKSQATEVPENAREPDAAADATENAREPVSAGDATADVPVPTTLANSESPAPAQEPAPAEGAVAAPAQSPVKGTVAVARREPAALESAWVVQLGSFASRDNAERLAAEVRTAGYRAFVARFESGKRVRYRVRVGPEQDRSQAERLARRLERDGRQVSVVSHP